MRASTESLIVLQACVQELSPHSFKAAVYAHLKGGLPDSSFSDGRGAAEPPLPGFDATDEDLVRKLAEWERRMDELANLALSVRKIQRDMLWQRPAPVAKAKVLAELELEADGKKERTWWCVSCARVKVSGYPHHSPVADEKRGGKDCELCRWCLDQFRDTGAWPPIEWVQARAEGRPIRVKVKPRWRIGAAP